MVTQQYPQRYRWDFIGLSTDDKPTPSTSEKVVNGSTFYCSDTSKLYVFCDGTWYERKPLGEGGGGGGTEYTAGDGIDITNDVISVTYADFTGTDGTTAGTTGLVPAPTTTDADKFLKSDGTWATAGGGGSSVTVVQSTGTSTTDVMSQNATTNMVYADPATQQLVCIGNGANAGTRSSSQDGRVAIGKNATATGHAGNIAIKGKAVSTAYPSIAIGSSGSTKNHTVSIGGSNYGQDGDRNVLLGFNSTVNGEYRQDCVALGYQATCTRSGEVNVGAGSTTYGYNSTSYRVIGGVHDGQLANDAVNVSQINSVIDAINTALNTNIPHIGA